MLSPLCQCRLFWSEDQRFLKQFKAGSLGARFKPFSKFPPCYKVRTTTCLAAPQLLLPPSNCHTCQQHEHLRACVALPCPHVSGPTDL